MLRAPDLVHTGFSAYYRADLDQITRSERNLFTSSEKYFRGLYHELILKPRFVSTQTAFVPLCCFFLSCVVRDYETEKEISNAERRIMNVEFPVCLWSVFFSIPHFQLSYFSLLTSRYAASPEAASTIPDQSKGSYLPIHTTS